MTNASAVVGAAQYLGAHNLLASIAVLAENRMIDKHTANALEPITSMLEKRLKAQTIIETQFLEVFAGAGRRGICLKGAALARWLYPSSTSRYRGDLDILVHPSDASWMRSWLADRDFGDPHWTVWGTQVALRHRKTGLVVDLHWRLSDHPIFHYWWDFEELWGQSSPLASALPNVRRLNTIMALQHAVVHRQASLAGGHARDLDLLDVKLLIDQLDPEKRSEFLVACRRKGISGLAAAVIEELHSQFGSVDDSLVAKLRDQGRSEWLSELVRGRRNAPRVWMMAIKAQPTWRARLSLARRALFPNREFMCPGDPVGTVVLVGRYIRRLARGLSQLRFA